jgi:hypothetical protein
VYHAYGGKALVVEDQGFSFLAVESEEWLMLISAFFDESGKFQDHSTVSFCGVAAVAKEFDAFGPDWNRELYRAGLKYLTMKEALNAKRSLSKKRPAKGTEKRVEALMPFVNCIKRHLGGVVFSLAVDVVAFKSAPSNIREIWGDNPNYLAFARALQAVLEIVHPEDKLSLICDDEESTALGMYKLYRKVKLVWPEAHSKCASISFADDEVFVPLQAADMIASLTRLRARNQLHKEPDDYRALFEALSSPEPSDKLWGFSSVIVDHETLIKLARDHAKHGS